MLLYPTPMGALTQLWAGTTQAGATLNGKVCVTFLPCPKYISITNKIPLVFDPLGARWHRKSGDQRRESERVVADALEDRGGQVCGEAREEAVRVLQALGEVIDLDMCRIFQDMQLQPHHHHYKVPSDSRPSADR